MYSSSPQHSRAASLSALLAPVQRNPASKSRRTASSSNNNTNRSNNNHQKRNSSSSSKLTTTTRQNFNNNKNNISSSPPRSIANEYELHNRKRNKNYSQIAAKVSQQRDDDYDRDEFEPDDDDKENHNNNNTTTTNNNTSKKVVKFDNSVNNSNNDEQDGGDVADSSSFSKNASRNTNNSRALVKYENNNNNHSSLTIIYDPDPEIDSLVKRRLGQDNSNRIRLTRTLTQVEQDLALARKEHSKLSSRANAIPHYQEQLLSLREECESLRDDIENLEIEFGFYQQRYRDIDVKLDPLETKTAKNKKKLEAAVKESRLQQMNATAANLQKRERLLTEEIQRLNEQRDRAIAMEREAAQKKEKEEEGVSAAVREQALRKALEEVREQHKIKRNTAVHSLQAQFSNEIRQLAEEEVVRETQESNKVGDFTKKLGRAETDNVAKKHEVTELTQRHAQATARLQELNADIAVEQQRLSQSESALAPAQEELESLTKLIESAQNHLEQQAVESQNKKDQKQKSENAASHAWQIELGDLEKNLASCEEKVSNLREKESNLSKQVEKKKKQRDDLDKSAKSSIANLMSQSQKKIDEGKIQAEKLTEEIQKFNAAAEKLEQEAAQIEQRLGASQKTEIIMQLQRQNGELQGQVDSLTKGNNKLDERLKKILTALGDDVLL